MKTNILHLYSDILNLYGDYGNVIIMKKCIEDEGYEVSLDKKTIGEDIDFDKYSFIYIGSGTERNLDVVGKDIKRFRNELKEAIEKNVVVLSTGNSIELFGKRSNDNSLNIFDFEVLDREERIVSSVIYKPCDIEIFTDMLEKENASKIKIFGYINKTTEIYHNLSPLFKVDEGVGENKKNDFEGIKYKNFYGTHIIGPLLAKNQLLAKLLVKKICLLNSEEKLLFERK